MKAAPGTYRLSTPGAPPCDVVVSADGNTVTTTFDTLDWVPAHGLYKARRLSLAMECHGDGTGLAFVGVTPGVAVPLTCAAL